ncbi:YggT family protein [Sutcliffiella horikoshii]|uniref:YggT family protein n=1 Tax=Sutcliffiella horikoshii TaxID=79883 RepID=UPI001F1C346F|nr:YggT family protein [Sutcliffiella horikoshii]MCG1020569.1 YggT family protein [Sutcliffiella horikoshii]
MYMFFNLLNQLVFIYTIALIIYIFMSWFPGARESSFGRILGRICEPYLDMFRRIIPPLGMIDISPIVAIFVLRYAVYGLQALFRMLGLY